MASITEGAKHKGYTLELDRHEALALMAELERIIRQSWDKDETKEIELENNW